MKDNNQERIIVSRYYLSKEWNGVVEKGGDSVFRIEYHEEDKFDYTIYPDNWEGEMEHVYKKVKLFHIIHDSTDKEIPITNYDKNNEPTKQVLMESLVEYGKKIGTVTTSISN